MQNDTHTNTQTHKHTLGAQKPTPKRDGDTYKISTSHHHGPSQHCSRYYTPTTTVYGPSPFLNWPMTSLELPYNKMDVCTILGKGSWQIITTVWITESKLISCLKIHNYSKSIMASYSMSITSFVLCTSTENVYSRSVMYVNRQNIWVTVLNYISQGLLLEWCSCRVVDM